MYAINDSSIHSPSFEIGTNRRPYGFVMFCHLILEISKEKCLPGGLFSPIYRRGAALSPTSVAAPMPPLRPLNCEPPSTAVSTAAVEDTPLQQSLRYGLRACTWIFLKFLL
ncbi:hypothetical protein CEXT_104491 [Caerostris extrusa]|uniref:Uncharacterized protein n=1 Tax=Caerostris extrusa TaxID=172846 RepID=A0AAV4QMD2_CAEEX|nr:hypothetical protein CEXT_104491 [Caerostris extrusa]